MLLVFNAHADDVTIVLPGDRWGNAWAVAVDTADPRLVPGRDGAEAARFGPTDAVTVAGRSVMVLRGTEGRS